MKSKTERDAGFRSHPFKIYRVKRLSELFDVDPSTIWRWHRDGLLPPAIQFSPQVKGWTEDQIAELLKKHQQEAADA